MRLKFISYVCLQDQFLHYSINFKLFLVWVADTTPIMTRGMERTVTASSEASARVLRGSSVTRWTDSSIP